MPASERRMDGGVTAAESATRGGDPSARLRRDGLHRKLVWLTFFRIVTVTVLLGGTATVTWAADPGLRRAAAPLYALVGLTYLASLGFALLLRTGRGDGFVAVGQILTDAGVAAAVVALTGRADSVFVFMFSIAIVNASILLFRRGALLGLALSAAGYLVVALEPATAPRAGILVAHLGAFAATAALAGYLAEQLRRTGARLEEREGDLAAITALHEAVVHSVSSGIVTLDIGGRITFLNRAAEEITGLRLRDVAGLPVASILPPFAAADGREQPRASIGPAREETRFTNARGDVLRVGFTAFPLAGGGGERLGSAVIFQDLTRLREMEDAVRRNERLADVGRLAAGLAHEIRNPLASMSGCVELLRSGDALRPDERRLMDIVLREASRLEALVERFLAYSRPPEPRRVPTDLAAVLREVCEVFARDPGAANVRVERALAHAPAACDPDQLRQVAWNLLLNAAQALGAAGRSGVVRVASGLAGERAWFSVEDDGPGVAPGDREKLFTPFFTTKPNGTGLGLATVHRIVEAHGGRIAVESEPGRGARFVVEVPLAPPPAAQAR
ncbi:two-component system sensor histidine kinase NtrB [Anaeromyxobacter oryzisoli]|uniref:two-component system sensor histidine kinase NtrB n=1 Tax=Anaeromyxobacter oryzisoli TaxID=2925408 RepID=UPI001F57E7F4|nr:ATP-binding protein [Anaeromyxobacter sp. SG63]